MGSYDGKTVIITGGAKGIGRGISLAFAEEGANVICADVDVAAGQKIVQDRRQSKIQQGRFDRISRQNRSSGKIQRIQN